MKTIRLLGLLAVALIILPQICGADCSSPPKGFGELGHDSTSNGVNLAAGRTMPRTNHALRDPTGAVVRVRLMPHPLTITKQSGSAN